MQYLNVAFATELYSKSCSYASQEQTQTLPIKAELGTDPADLPRNMHKPYPESGTDPRLRPGTIYAQGLPQTRRSEPCPNLAHCPQPCPNPIQNLAQTPLKTFSKPCRTAQDLARLCPGPCKTLTNTLPNTSLRPCPNPIKLSRILPHPS